MTKAAVTQVTELSDEWNALNRFDQAILFRKWPQIADKLAALPKTDTGATK